MNNIAIHINVELGEEGKATILDHQSVIQAKIKQVEIVNTLNHIFLMEAVRVQTYIVKFTNKHEKNKKEIVLESLNFSSNLLFLDFGELQEYKIILKNCTISNCGFNTNKTIDIEINTCSFNEINIENKFNQKVIPVTMPITQEAINKRYDQNDEIKSLTVHNSKFKTFFSAMNITAQKINITYCEFGQVMFGNSIIDTLYINTGIFKKAIDTIFMKSKMVQILGSTFEANSNFDYSKIKIFFTMFSNFEQKISFQDMQNDGLFMLESCKFKENVDLTRFSFGGFLVITSSYYHNGIIISSISALNNKEQVISINNGYKTILKNIDNLKIKGKVEGIITKGENLLENCSNSFAMIKNILDNNGNKKQADRFYAMEMRLYRYILLEQTKSTNKIFSFFKKIFSLHGLSWLNDLISGYYQNFFKAVLWFVGVNIIFALINACFHQNWNFLNFLQQTISFMFVYKDLLQPNLNNANNNA